MNDISQNDTRKVFDTLVLSGGAYLGFYELGALQSLHEQIQRDGEMTVFQFRKIRATSVGSLCATIFSLVLSNQISFKDIMDYAVGRPWHKTQMEFSHQKQGLLDRSFFVNILEPVFSSLDIDINISLEQFSLLCDISLEFFATNVNTTNIVEFTNERNGDISLIDAIHASSAIPFIFTPVEYDGELYADGGFIYNYPCNDCCQNTTFGIRFEKKNAIITPSTSMFKYGTTFLHNLLNRSGISGTLKHQLNLSCRSQNGDDMKAALLSKSMREKMIWQGYQQATEQLKPYAIFSTN